MGKQFLQAMAQQMGRRIQFIGTEGVELLGQFLASALQFGQALHRCPQLALDFRLTRPKGLQEGF